MRNEATRGLEWRRQYGRGGTEIGVARARDIARGANLPLETVNRMVSYFARHEIDQEAEGWRPGEEGFPSAGRIAWALWGGDPGRAWARRIVEEYRMHDDDDIETNSQYHNDGGAARARRAQWLRENAGKCALGFEGCAGEADTVDHVKPLADGGKDEPANWRRACRHCNSARGAKQGKREGILDAAEIRRAFAAQNDASEHLWVRLEERDVVESEDGPVINGLASVFNTRARVRLPDGRIVAEEVAPSAFNNTLERSDIFLLWAHDWAQPLARTGAGNLSLSIAEEGLRFAAALPDTQAGRDAAELVRSGIVSQMSFGFTVPAGGDRVSIEPDGTLLRTLTDVRLHEVSLVSRAAYGAATHAALRSDAFGLLCRSLDLDEETILDAVSTRSELSVTVPREPGVGTTSEAERAGTTALSMSPRNLLARLDLAERAQRAGIHKEP